MQRKSCKYDSILSEEFYISESQRSRPWASSASPRKRLRPGRSRSAMRSASTARAVSSASCNAEKRIRRPAKPFLQRSPPCPAVPRRTPPALPGCPARGPAAHRLSGLEAQHFRLPRAGVHTALETCGLADWETFRELVPHLDLFLYDIKHMDRPTGGSRARAAGGFWTTCACCSAWAKRF